MFTNTFTSPTNRGVGNFLGPPQAQGWSNSAVQGMGASNFGASSLPTNYQGGPLTTYQRYMYGLGNNTSSNFMSGGGGGGGGGGSSGGSGFSLPEAPTGLGDVNIKGTVPLLDYLPDSVVETGRKQGKDVLQSEAAPQQFVESFGATPMNLASGRSAQYAAPIQEAIGSKLQEISARDAMIPLEAELARYGFGTKNHKAIADEQLGLANVSVNRDFDTLQRYIQSLNQSYTQLQNALA